jgi:hypothetical protein
VTVTAYNETGRWVWLVFTDNETGAVLRAFWGFAPPAGYQSGEGFALLDQYLNGHGKMCETPNRTDVTNLRGVNAGFCLGLE